MATTAPRQPRIPPAVEAEGTIAEALGRWMTAHADWREKTALYDRVRRGDHATAADAWHAMDCARRWEGQCWHELALVVPAQTERSYRLGDVIACCSAIHRNGLSLRAYRDGELIRRSP